MTNNQLANIAPSDNFATAASEAQSSAIVGERLKFSKGRYLVGRGAGETFSTDTPLHAIDCQAGWVRFQSGRVTAQHIGYPLAEREELGDLDEADWPPGVDGEPSDPWVNQRYLYLIDPDTGAEYTFVTSSWGGRAAVEQLARQVYIKRQATPGAVAVVKLETGFKNSQRYGAIPCPKFNITGWVGDGPIDTAPKHASSRSIAGKAGTRAPLASRDLDDEIPF